MTQITGTIGHAILCYNVNTSPSPPPPNNIERQLSSMHGSDFLNETMDFNELFRGVGERVF